MAVLGYDPIDFSKKLNVKAKPFASKCAQSQLKVEEEVDGTRDKEGEE